jgi:hypothetical protein
MVSGSAGKFFRKILKDFSKMDKGKMKNLFQKWPKNFPFSPFPLLSFIFYGLFF